MATHSSILVSWTEEPGRPQSIGWLGVGHAQATSFHIERNGEPQGSSKQKRDLVGLLTESHWLPVGRLDQKLRVERRREQRQEFIKKLLQQSKQEMRWLGSE